MEWITQHGTDLWSIFTGVVAVASIVAKLTPTETDNKIIGAILTAIDKIALNNPPTKVVK